ncbi:MAG TPA: hypothetical protein VFQ79_20235, partial [Bryobacteraceae bacterium]|nr:hypothetical protein [Bryobacteraceae bacterium]
MILRTAVVYLAAAMIMPAAPPASEVSRPKAGEVEILKSSELKPGMTGTAWTVFTGSDAEPVPVEIIGLWKNAWGPKQDI